MKQQGCKILFNRGQVLHVRITGVLSFIHHLSNSLQSYNKLLYSVFPLLGVGVSIISTF